MTSGGVGVAVALAVERAPAALAAADLPAVGFGAELPTAVVVARVAFGLGLVRSGTPVRSSLLVGRSWG